MNSWPGPVAFGLSGTRFQPVLSRLACSRTNQAIPVKLALLSQCRDDPLRALLARHRDHNWPFVRSLIDLSDLVNGGVHRLQYVTSCYTSLCTLMLRLQQKFWRLYRIKFLTLVFASTFARAFYSLRAALPTVHPSGPGTTNLAWPAQPAVADQTRYNGKRSDEIRPTPSQAPPWTGQAVAVSSRTFFRPFSDSTPIKLLCPNALHVRYRVRTLERAVVRNALAQCEIPDYGLRPAERFRAVI